MSRCLHCRHRSTVCVHVCFYVTAGMLEKSEAQAASWPNPPIAGLCGWLWTHISRSSAGWSLEDTALNSLAGAHAGPTLKNVC